MTDAVTVEGLDTLRATVARSAREVDDMSAPSEQAATYLATQGRSNAPHLTGRLAASLTPTSTRDTAEVTSGLPYANRTHYGYARYGQRAQPFLTDALATGEVVIVNKYADRVDDVVGSIKGK